LGYEPNELPLLHPAVSLSVWRVQRYTLFSDWQIFLR